MVFAETRPNVYSEVFHAWKKARNRLSTAAKEYVDACRSFEAVCSRPLGRNTTRSMLEEALAALDSEVPRLSSSLEKATSANNAMKVLRNKSTTLVPISILPSELLSRVFELLCHSYMDTDPSDNLSDHPRVLACVSLDAYRSDISSRDRSIEFHKRAETQVKYARESLLHVNFHEAGELISIDGFEKAINLVVRAAPRLGSLICQPGVNMDFTLPRLLSSWVQHGVPGSVHTLHLVGYYSRLFRQDLRLSFPESQPIARVEEFFAPIRYLALHHLFADWSSALYYNLVELNLSYAPSFVHFPTVAQFAAVLSASPGLRALKLSGFCLKPSSPAEVVGPVRLEQLEVLFLKSIHRRSLKLLLPLLQPGHASLYMRFEVPKQGVDFAHYVRLLRRSRVVKLMVEGTGTYPSQALLASLAGVQHLFLTNFVIDPVFLESMADSLIPYAKEQHPTIWPHLRNLHLVHCSFEGIDWDGLPEEPIPYQFMVWIWGFSCFYGEAGDILWFDSPGALNLLNTISRYIPGMQDIPPDGKPMLDAWKSALDFAEFG